MTTPGPSPEVVRDDAAWWADKVGRRVIFRYHHGEEQHGVVTSTNDRFVFVRFGAATSAESCEPAQLRLAVGYDRG